MSVTRATLAELEHVQFRWLRCERSEPGNHPAHEGDRCPSGSPRSTSRLASSLRKWATDLQGRGLARPRRTTALPSRPRAALTRWACRRSGSGVAGAVVTLDVAVALEACAHELRAGPAARPAVAALALGWHLGRRGLRIALGASEPIVRDALRRRTHALAEVGQVGGCWPREAIELTPATRLRRQPPIRRLRVLDPAAGAVDLDRPACRYRSHVGAAAEAAGVARGALATAVDYAKCCEQFRAEDSAAPGGQHLCADARETAEAVTHRRVGRGDPRADDAGRAWRSRAFAADAMIASDDRAVEVAKIVHPGAPGGQVRRDDAFLTLRAPSGLRAPVGDAPTRRAGRLTDTRAVTGVRRRVHLDLDDGRDDVVRGGGARATVDRSRRHLSPTGVPLRRDRLPSCRTGPLPTASAPTRSPRSSSTGSRPGRAELADIVDRAGRCRRRSSSTAPGRAAQAVRDPHCSATWSGASCSPSRAPGPTWPRCRPGPRRSTAGGA